MTNHTNTQLSEERLPRRTVLPNSRAYDRAGTGDHSLFSNKHCCVCGRPCKGTVAWLLLTRAMDGTQEFAITSPDDATEEERDSSMWIAPIGGDCLKKHPELAHAVVDFHTPSPVPSHVNVYAPRVCIKCGHEERFSDNEGGTCEKRIVLEQAELGVETAECGCFCAFTSPSLKFEEGAAGEQKARYESAHEARYTMTHAVHPDIVVLWFLALKSHWFDDPSNMFFGMREQAKIYLYKWVETGELADDHTTLEIATAMKFCEWLESSWTAATPLAPSDAVRKAAQEISNALVKNVFPADYVAGIESIISRYLPVVVEEGEKPRARCTCDHFEHKDTGECVTCGMFCGPVSNAVGQRDLQAWQTESDDGSAECATTVMVTHTGTIARTGSASAVLQRETRHDED